MDELDAQIQRWHREQAASRKLAAIPGIGPLTASALTYPSTLGFQVATPLLAKIKAELKAFLTVVDVLGV